MRLRKSCQVGSNIYMFGSRWVNFYVVVEGDDAIIVDAGYPRYDGQLAEGLKASGMPLDSVLAVFVTHHHIDHVGTAEQLRSRGARVLAHERDADKIAGTTASHPPAGFYKDAWRPMMLAYLAHTVVAGGARHRPVKGFDAVTDGQTFDLPGRPRVVRTPGHTNGHFSVLLAERGTFFTGDALVNFDYATGERGPKLHRFNEDRAAASASLDRLDDVEAGTLLFGHGDPWTRGLDAALSRAKDRSLIGS